MAKSEIWDRFAENLPSWVTVAARRTGLAVSE